MSQDPAGEKADFCLAHKWSLQCSSTHAEPKAFCDACMHARTHGCMHFFTYTCTCALKNGNPKRANSAREQKVGRCRGQHKVELGSAVSHYMVDSISVCVLTFILLARGAYIRNAKP